VRPYLRLLGGARIDRDGDEGHVVRGRAAHRRRLALLALLSAAPGHRLSRERIIAYLWAERDSESGRKLLSESLHVIRREFGDGTLISVADDIRLDTTVLGSDVVDFRAALAEGALDRAVTLYAGPFLDGWFVEDAREFDDWADAERAAIAGDYASALETLAERAEAAGDWLAAVTHWRARSRMAPTATMPTVRLAQALSAQGDRAGALKVLDAHSALLAEDELPVDAAVETLRASLKRGDGSSVVTRAVSLMAATPAMNRPSSGAEVAAAALTAVIAPFVEQSPDRDAVPSASARRPASRARVWRGAIVMTMVLLVAAWFARGMFGVQPADASRAPTSSGSDPFSVAVLFFQHDANDDIGYLADAITGKLIDELSSVPALRVVSRTGVLHYRGREASLPLDSIARALHVGMLVEGTVQRRGDRLRVTVGLVNATTGARVGPPLLVERSMTPEQMFSLEDDVATALTPALRRQLGKDVRLLASRDGSTVPAAQEYADRAEYLRNSAWALRRTGRPTDAAAAEQALVRADSLLALAERADRRWQTPIITRGWVARERSRLGLSKDAKPLLRDAIDHASRVLREDSSNTRALELRGTARWALYAGTTHPGVDSAKRDLTAAVERDSLRVIAAATLSQLLRVNAKGDADRREAIGLARRAYEQDVFLASAEGAISQLFRAFYALAQMDSARAWCDRGHALLPTDWRFVDCSLTLARANLRATTPAAAWQLVRILDELDPQTTAGTTAHTYLRIYRQLTAAAVSAMAGDRDSARAVLARALRDTQSDADQRIDIKHDESLIRFALGERREGAEALRQYLAIRTTFVGAVLTDPAWRQFGLDSASLSRLMEAPARP
jgi:DNA-binding SARP family transcriptional activator/TolB-like protein